MPRGLLFGPDLPAGPDRLDLPPMFKKTKRKTKGKVKSRSKGESRSKVQRAKKGEERKKKREEWLLMRAQRRVEEKQRKAEMGEPVVKKVKAKRDPKSHHGTEQVDATIIKLLGRSHKSHKKMAPKSKDKKVEDVAGPKWRHGMREERHESRSVKAKPPRKTSEKVEKSKATVSEEVVISSEELNLKPFPRKKTKASAAGSEEIIISSEGESTVVVERQPTDYEEKKSMANATVSEEIVISSECESTVEERQSTDYGVDKLVQAEEMQSKLPPIVDVGPDYEADEGLCSTCVGATELVWPLELMPPCMEFYQVRKQKLITELTQIHGWILHGLLHNCNLIYYCSGARRPPLLSGGSPGNLANASSRCHPCSSLPFTPPNSKAR